MTHPDFLPIAEIAGLPDSAVLSECLNMFGDYLLGEHSLRQTHQLVFTYTETEETTE